ncbi:MAG: carbon storage regulator [Pirellulales bacterium]
MLVLTRKQQEKIQIGNGITITVLKLKGKSVRLGIEAPTEVPVLRGELLFDSERQSSQTDTAGGEESVAAPPLPTKTARVRESNWTSEANAVLQRVSRSEADKLRGPLRTMLDRRTSVGG